MATLVLARNTLVTAEYSLGVRDSLMIAHSFKGSEFGPAQRLHGATYTCDVAFCARKLRPGLNWVLDIGQASEIVAAVLKEYHLHNLDEIFPEENTTTEWMCERGGGRRDARLLEVDPPRRLERRARRVGGVDHFGEEGERVVELKVADGVAGAGLRRRGDLRGAARRGERELLERLGVVAEQAGDCGAGVGVRPRRLRGRGRGGVSS